MVSVTQTSESLSVTRINIAGHRLPAAEAAVLRVLLDADGPLLVGDVQTRLPGRQRAHTTVATLLGRLIERGLVAREPDGRRHRYRSVGGERALAVAALEQALARVDDPAGALVAFIDTLPANTRRMLQRRLRGRQEGR